jgi:hypothetical protein
MGEVKPMTDNQYNTIRALLSLILAKLNVTPEEVRDMVNKLLNLD